MRHNFLDPRQKAERRQQRVGKRLKAETASCHRRNLDRGSVEIRPEWAARAARAGHASRAGRFDLDRRHFSAHYLLVIFVDGSSTGRVYLHARIGYRYKDEIVLAVSGNRVGSLTWRGRIGVDLANDKGVDQRVVCGVENWDPNGLKSAEVHVFLSRVEPDFVGSDVSDRRQNFTGYDVDDITAACNKPLTWDQSQTGRTAGRRKHSPDQLPCRIDFIDFSVWVLGRSRYCQVKHLCFRVPHGLFQPMVCRWCAVCAENY